MGSGMKLTVRKYASGLLCVTLEVLLSVYAVRGLFASLHCGSPACDAIEGVD